MPAADCSYCSSLPSSKSIRPAKPSAIHPRLNSHKYDEGIEKSLKNVNIAERKKDYSQLTHIQNCGDNNNNNGRLDNISLWVVSRITQSGLSSDIHLLVGCLSSLFVLSPSVCRVCPCVSNSVLRGRPFCFFLQKSSTQSVKEILPFGRRSAAHCCCQMPSTKMELWLLFTGLRDFTPRRRDIYTLLACFNM